MKKVKIFLVALITVLLASGAVLAANWPNMSTGPSGSSGGTGGGGSDYRVSCQGSRTRYVLYDQNNTVIKNYVDTSGLIGNTHEWFSYKKKNGKIEQNMHRKNLITISTYTNICTPYMVTMIMGNHIYGLIQDI